MQLSLYLHPLWYEAGSASGEIQGLKAFKDRILVTTDLFARGIDIVQVNIVINYDFPKESEQYYHRVGRAGRFGTKGMAVSFISTDEDATEFQKIQDGFAVEIPELPAEIKQELYMA